MSKISDGLRKSASETFYDPLKSELNQAADRIDGLETALREIAFARPECCAISDAMQHIARRALEETCSD